MVRNIRVVGNYIYLKLFLGSDQFNLEKKVKDVEEEKSKTTNNVTNNALFVGSTSELSKILKKGILNNNDQDIK